MTAKASPREALKEVEENGEGFHFDIIMTVVHDGEEGDGFDGFDLLERVRDRYPVISEYAHTYACMVTMRLVTVHTDVQSRMFLCSFLRRLFQEDGDEDNQ